ncbi:hypothetical protein [Pseudomonas fluorescens]|uniref:Uncharacterized protein n=2 Tax=Pseudomonas fluorescens TaxID=294 RepID=A0ABY1TEM6_PSEFL|nr:hypothetical protein [Pseudomonas fluorescens]MCI4605333.1 hypothetical protein [Pseudomonas fluorescens]PQB00170.1 hypothetical protein B0A76_14065 [Pseudomonas fluorescens]RFP96769.1 hypothetical protein D0N73_07675 [Pseudomonas fluorescens]RMO68177.1 hypothetical protein ALQ35_03908 [Pseudomonas fluorescens]TWR48663.1 hypothetical protein FIP59_07320 [Pseudomonas fluorescens]
MSQIEIWEGQRFAAQMIEQASHLPKCMFDGRGPVETMASNLEVASQVRPADYAKGMLQVIEVVRHGLL